MHKISVSIGSPEMDIAEQWAALIARAPANVFMHPAALKVADAAGFADIQMLLAWQHGELQQQLVGVWALQRMHISPLWPSLLSAPPYKYSFLSNPVVDPKITAAVIAAFFDAIDRARSLPKIIRLKYLDGSAETYPAIMNALTARGARVLKLAERERPYVTKDLGPKKSGSTRKKLRQDWNRLSALGTIDIVNDRTRAAVQDAFETYLALEAASWKGSRGTALLCDEKDATFARNFISDLAAGDNASVALLRLDGRAVAAQVLLYCGTMAYTWKTAFDVEFSKFSPGALLVDKMTELLFAEGGVDAIESCSPEGGFMNQIWDGRRTTIDLLADVGAKTSLGFRAVVASERGYAQLRGLRNRLRDRSWSPRAWRKRIAISR
ncbi:MAG: GNAT family N-acetyltransferase [Rhizobiales bacterium]|nr:GNAT family N-acetyltransferase [Hyphomicrobiales bacterium]